MQPQLQQQLIEKQTSKQSIHQSNKKSLLLIETTQSKKYIALEGGYFTSWPKLETVTLTLSLSVLQQNVASSMISWSLKSSCSWKKKWIDLDAVVLFVVSTLKACRLAL